MGSRDRSTSDEVHHAASPLLSKRNCSFSSANLARWQASCTTSPYSSVLHLSTSSGLSHIQQRRSIGVSSILVFLGRRDSSVAQETDVAAAEGCVLDRRIINNAPKAAGTPNCAKDSGVAQPHQARGRVVASIRGSVSPLWRARDCLNNSSVLSINW